MILCNIEITGNMKTIRILDKGIIKKIIIDMETGYMINTTESNNINGMVFNPVDNLTFF